MPVGAPAFAAVAPPILSRNSPEVGEAASLEVSDILPTISTEDLQYVLSPSRMRETKMCGGDEAHGRPTVLHQYMSTRECTGYDQTGSQAGDDEAASGTRNGQSNGIQRITGA